MRASTIRRRRIESDSETETEDSDNNEDDVPEEFDVNWRIPLGNKTNITFSDSSGTNTNQSEIFACTEPHDFYFLFVTEEIFEIIAKQTNIYATQRKSELQSYRLDQWYETNANEIKRFFGLIIWMGLVRLPKIELYWSTYEGYKQALPRTIMSRNRFELLLRFVHFSNNEENDPNNRLSKVAHIIDHLNSNFKKYYNPDEVVCVDESLVPFRGRILFRQYIKQKRHRYGIKVFKLCSGPGYTYSFQIYTGKGENTSEIYGNKSTEIVMALCQDILGKGHTICTDNWYTSVNLAEKLIDMHTHLLGTLRKNRRDNPKEVVAQKLKRGDVIARENKNGVTVLKWKDKRDVLMLSTKHSAEMTTIQKRNCTKEKPRMVVEYNLGKSSVDLSDQMVAYCSPLRKTIKCNNGIIEKCISINIYTNYVLLSFAASPVTGGPHGAVAKSSAGHR
ncbi:piggyBac transposable element-derived protein 4-like [Cataglyphis hispanica]|nr:piggyBac transposable element-derived protein 4-like [Cataglyphis hispanica]